MTSKKKFNLTIDERTNNLSDEAIYCRTHGHRWVMQSLGVKRFNELLDEGKSEFKRYCENGCGSTWIQGYDIQTGEVLYNDRSYPTGNDYLLKPNSGRLPRAAARVAFFARHHPRYA